MTASSSAYKARRQAGFALVMTLLLIGIAGTTMGIVARQSMGLASQAEAEQSRLQQDWGTRSLQRALTPVVLNVMDLAESQSDEPLIQYHTPVQLNGLTFDLPSQGHPDERR